MMLLLCPDCCQWREPVEGRCCVCAGTLDVAVPDPSLETLADEIGDLQGLLGEAELARAVLPKRGRLCVTANGVLFVPIESRVIVFEGTHRGAAARPSWVNQFVSRVWSRLSGNVPPSRFDCERRTNDLTARGRLALADLLRSDPGVVFWSRDEIATWRRQRGQWEFIRPNHNSWPERISMRDRDGERALQTWLETTECPLPVNVR